MATTPNSGSPRQSPETLVMDRDPRKKTILIYSPDLNFGFSMSMLLQDRFNVVTTTNVATLSELAAECRADLVLLDAIPTGSLVERIDGLKGSRPGLPVILFYVYEQKSAELEKRARTHVDSVFYKPLDVAAVSRRIQELLLPS